MKIGYPCQNLTLGCTCAHTFRLHNYTEERFIATVEENLSCLEQILTYNLEHQCMFFRISSDLIPFASHPVCSVDWVSRFASTYKRLGTFIKSNDMRISMHPDQFVLINSPDARIVQNSVSELLYHAQLLDALGLSPDAKIQIHVGGVYGNKDASLKRFIDNYRVLPDSVQQRLSIENDDRLYTVDDCYRLYEFVGTPIIFDNFHWELNPSGAGIRDSILKSVSTWQATDGVLMIDYSSQQVSARVGKHTAHIDLEHFSRFIKELNDIDADLMFEIKDKERSALDAKAFLTSKSS